jgi:hypothetical protein
MTELPHVDSFLPRRATGARRRAGRLRHPVQEISGAAVGGTR